MEELRPLADEKAPPPTSRISTAIKSTTSTSSSAIFTATDFLDQYSITPHFPKHSHTASTSDYSSSFYLESSSPPTPLYPPSTSSSFATVSGASSVNQSSCSSPTTEFSVGGLTTEPPMPRLSEEQCFDGTVDATNNRSAQMHQYAASNPENPFQIHSGAQLVTNQQHHADPSMYTSTSQDCELDNAMFSDALTPTNNAVHKRQRSAESHKTNLSSKINLSSFLGRRRHRKNSSLSTNPTLDTGVSHSSRSSSFASARHHDVGSSSQTSLQRTPNLSVEPASPTSPFDVLFADCADISEPIDRFKHSSTPLLPPMMEPDQDDTIIPSPLQSPSIADTTQSMSRVSLATSEGSRSFHEGATGNLSKRPSVSSVGRPRKNTGSAMDPPSINRSLGSPPTDKWSMKLGHANFTIDPEPHVPEVFDMDTWQTLLSDREAAHAEYCRHQTRTLEHYGRNSKIFILTEEKWAEIDAEWTRAQKLAHAGMIARGVRPEHLAISASQPMVRMPTLNPHIDGKFPKLGDEDIVGPMIQSPPLQQPAHTPSPTRKPSSAKLFTGKLGGIFGKSNDSR